MWASLSGSLCPSSLATSSIVLRCGPSYHDAGDGNSTFRFLETKFKGL